MNQYQEEVKTADILVFNRKVVNQVWSVFSEETDNLISLESYRQSRKEQELKKKRQNQSLFFFPNLVAAGRSYGY